MRVFGREAIPPQAKKRAFQNEISWHETHSNKRMHNDPNALELKSMYNAIHIAIENAIPIFQWVVNANGFCDASHRILHIKSK